MAERLNSTFQLNDGRRIPVLGLGTWPLVSGGECERACSCAIQHGYRQLDTADLYGNEEDVGKSVRQCRVPREELFVTTKLWTPSHGKQNAIEAFRTSLKRYATYALPITARMYMPTS